jgi:hypothetical protein
MVEVLRQSIDLESQHVSNVQLPLQTLKSGPSYCQDHSGFEHTTPSRCKLINVVEYIMFLYIQQLKSTLEG